MKILTGTMLALFLGLMFVSLFQLSGQMAMSEGMSDCPFMAHEEVICSMNLSDYISAWKSVFATLIPAALSVFLGLGLAVLVASTAPHLIRKRLLYAIPIYWRQLQQVTYTYSVRPYQDLFSSGILHPKLF